MIFRLARLGALIAALSAALWTVPAMAAGSGGTTLQEYQTRARQALEHGDDGTALAILAAAHEAYPNAAGVTRDLEKSVQAGLPSRLERGLLAGLPAEQSSLPDGLGLLVVPKDYLPTQAVEPQHGTGFSRTCYLYLHGIGAGAGSRDLLRQFCQVHYTLPQDAPLAARIGRLLVLAHHVLVAQTGREPPHAETPFHVWICRSGPSGGEQWQNNLYFYDPDGPCSSIEWIREVVHEYSHLALPAVGGYQDPEYWANGYLGERLIIRWLARTPGGPALVQQVWGDFSGWGNFERLLIAPALALYRRVGPNPQWLARTDASGMRYLIGQVLTFDDKYGGRRLGQALDNLPRFREAHATDLAAALGEAAPAPPVRSAGH